MPKSREDSKSVELINSVLRGLIKIPFFISRLGCPAIKQEKTSKHEVPMLACFFLLNMNISYIIDTCLIKGE